MKLLDAVDEKGKMKIEICNEFGIANFNLSVNVKNKDNIRLR